MYIGAGLLRGLTTRLPIIDVCVTHSPVSRSSKSIQALGPLGLNMMEFCKAFNAETTAVVPNTPMQVQWMGRVDGLG